MMKHWIIVFFSIAVVFCSLGVTELQAQDNTQREEVQRYFGYEILPYRYLTLPFDVSVNSNETGVFVDIGCVYFIFLPLFILLYFTKRKLLLSFFSISMMLIWIIGASNSYVSTKKIGPQKGDEQNLKVVMEKVSKEADPMAYMTTRIYLGTHKMYKPLLAMKYEKLVPILRILVSGFLFIASIAGFRLRLKASNTSCSVLFPI